ncbi:uncharacterized protein LOC134670471, partial [Cydia fagiglandana]|uniref:uncharacterized protein LOC134670471 n=1 Tax=Cydia fagiglandana TaxID=1458189 RepID=UPI002FEE631A
VIDDVSCHDCAASQGGCKHALCFLMWLVKRTEEPSPTSTECYWKRPKLSEAITKDKFIAISDIGKKRSHSSISSCDVPTLEDFLEEAKKHKIGDSMLLNYQIKKPILNDFCIFDMMLDFVSNIPANILKIEDSTKSQVDSKLWHSLRQSRITASKIYEVSRYSRCTTKSGSLVQGILGQYKVPETKAIKRGKRLEGEVIKKLETELEKQIYSAGFTLITPIIGASPDGVTSDFVIEVKCPTTRKTMLNYVKNNTVCKKFQAQVQLQVCAIKKTRGLFCVADPQFETNHKIYKYWIKYDKVYTDELLLSAEKFWKENIFVTILQSVK